MWRILRPQDSITEPELDRGLRMLIREGVCAQIMGVLTGGAFLVAFAILLGASNLVIGLIAALAPLAQILQLPGIYVIEKIRRRKALVVLASTLGRLSWLLIAALPFFVPPAWQVALLMLALAVHYSLGTISTLSFTSWARDLIPDKILGSFTAKRFAAATAVGAVLSLAGGLGVDFFKQRYPEEQIYSVIFLLGAVFGLAGTAFLLGVPEPRMEPRHKLDLRTLIAEPLTNVNFRQLLFFTASWSFATNLAAPFFTVYMLKRLDLPMGLILALAVASQLTNAAFFRFWGKLADRFSNKTMIAEAGPWFILSILLWPFTTMPGPHALTIALLVLIHVLAGMSTAGVTLCSANIAFKLSPRGRATAYLAVNSLTSGAAATLAPILGGLAATWLEEHELRLTLSWLTIPTGRTWELPAVILQGLDFLFLLSFVLGLYALHRLLAVREEGEVEKGIVFELLRIDARKFVRSVANVAGLRDTFYFPYSHLQRPLERAEGDGKDQGPAPPD